MECCSSQRSILRRAIPDHSSVIRTAPSQPRGGRRSSFRRCDPGKVSLVHQVVRRIYQDLQHGTSQLHHECLRDRYGVSRVFHIFRSSSPLWLSDRTFAMVIILMISTTSISFQSILPPDIEEIIWLGQGNLERFSKSVAGFEWHLRKLKSLDQARKSYRKERWRFWHGSYVRPRPRCKMLADLWYTLLQWGILLTNLGCWMFFFWKKFRDTKLKGAT